MKHFKNNIIHSVLVAAMLLLQAASSIAQTIVVDAAGKGNFTTIQAAIESLTDNAVKPRTVFVKNGVYNEKVFITKNNIIITGESREKTIITQAIARDIFRCNNPDDWGVATLNLNGNDITLQNLTVQNNYGFQFDKPLTVPCATDTAKHEKAVRKDGHQMALRSFATTRLKVVNCIFKAFGGDTVSPWNVEEGMFYFKDCVMEGGVDFYCPRGWAYAENCTFVAHTGTASIWHDGSKHEDSKTVLKNCVFKGYDGFKLGRYHKDAQFYLLDCLFADNMANEKIYLVPTINTILWGERIYYFNCHRKAGDYTWFADNLQSAKDAPKAVEITALWVFKNKWNPVNKKNINR